MDVVRTAEAAAIICPQTFLRDVPEAATNHAAPVNRAAGATRAEHAHAWRRAAPEAALVLGFLFFGALHAAYSGIGEDESFYASAAHRVADGQTPYIDFMIPQGPVAPYAYALALPFGLHAARLLGLAAGACAIVLAIAAARRMGGRLAGLVAGGVLAASLPFLVWSGSVSPLPLAALLMVAAAWTLATRTPTPTTFAIAGALLGLAAGVRLNLAVAIPLLVLHAGLAVHDPRRRAHAALAASLGACATLALSYGPFLLADAQATRWGILGYHLLDGRDPSTGLAALLKYKADGVGHLFATFPLVLTGLAFILVLTLERLRRDPRGLLRHDLLPCHVGLVVLATLGVTFTKTYVQPHYLVPVLPLAAILLGLLVARLHDALAQPQARRALLAFATVGIALGAIAAAPAAIHRVADENDLDDLRDAAAYVEARVAPDETVLTFLPAVPILAHRDPTPGTEMGAFSYYPAMPREQAERLHVLDLQGLKDLLERREPAALVLKDDDFTRTPFPTARLAPADQERALQELRTLIEKGYRPAATFGDEGRIHVYLRDG